MSRQGYVYLDEAYFTYPVNSKIQLAAAAVGFRDGYKGDDVVGDKPDIYKWWGIARRGKITGRELDVLGMIVADGLVELAKPKHFVTPKIYHTCSEIGKWTLPYLVNHEWREETQFDRRLRRRIAERIELTNCNTKAQKYYRNKQTIGYRLVEELKAVKIPHKIMAAMRPFDILNINTMELAKSEGKPPDWYRN